MLNEEFQELKITVTDGSGDTIATITGEHNETPAILETIHREAFRTQIETAFGLICDRPTGYFSDEENEPAEEQF